MVTQKTSINSYKKLTDKYYITLLTPTRKIRVNSALLIVLKVGGFHFQRGTNTVKL